MHAHSIQKTTSNSASSLPNQTLSFIVFWMSMIWTSPEASKGIKTNLNLFHIHVWHTSWASGSIACRLQDKFVVHAQPEKAEALERLSKEFLSCNLERNYPKVHTVIIPRCDLHLAYRIWLSSSPSLLPSFLLSRPLPPKSDAHYGVLLFLLCLSESPVNTDYTPPLKTILTQQGSETAAVVKYTFTYKVTYSR